jgi:hypothetical protein
MESCSVRKSLIVVNLIDGVKMNLCQTTGAAVGPETDVSVVGWLAVA